MNRGMWLGMSIITIGIAIIAVIMLYSFVEVFLLLPFIIQAAIVIMIIGGAVALVALAYERTMDTADEEEIKERV